MDVAKLKAALMIVDLFVEVKLFSEAAGEFENQIEFLESKSSLQTFDDPDD